MARSISPLIDPEIETLSRVFDVAALASALRGSRLGSWDPGAIEEIQLRALRHHEGQRCTVEIAIRTGADWHHVIGKVYSDDRLDVFRAMEGIEQAGFGPANEFAIPQPLAYLPALRLLVLEKAEGRVAKQVFREGDEASRAAAAKRCALWLARFHSCAPRTGPMAQMTDIVDFKSVRRRLAKITKLDGVAGDKVARLFHRLEAAASSLKDVELCAGHGSFSASHVLFSEDRTVVFDWDGFDLADPARDVARFLCHLPDSGLGQPGSLRALDGIGTIFLDTYLSAGRQIAPENFHFFAAVICLNSALRNLRRSARDRQNLAKAEAKLEQGFAALSEVNA